jgi:hypothetical protein
MSPAAASIPARRVSSLWDRPERVAAWAYALGTVAAASSLGIFAMVEEQSNHFAGAGSEERTLAGAHAAALVVEAAVWGGLVRAAVSVRGRTASALLTSASVVAGLLTLFAIIASGVSHGPPSMYPTAGVVIALVLDAALVLSFRPVLRLARRVRRGGTEQGALDVSAAGCAWAAALATLGLVLVPGPRFWIPCAFVLLAAFFGGYRVFSLAREGGDPKPRALLLRGLALGATRVALAALVLVPLRLHEQATTRNPAIIAIYDHVTSYCDVRPAGREGDVSLWLVDCGSSLGPTVGWDERTHTLLQDEKLYERVPRLRSVPPYSTARP